MSEYSEYRIDYINNWPDCEPFEVEKQYQDRIQKFIDAEKRFPYTPMRLWKSEDVAYNKTISFIIDSLDVIEKYPHHAFAFIFRGVDLYGKHIFHTTNETICLKKMSKRFSDLCDSNPDVKSIFEELFKFIPFSVVQFLYSELYSPTSGGNNSRAYTRVTTDENNCVIPENKAICDWIFNKFGFDSADYTNTIRKGSSLIRRLLKQNSINIDGTETVISLNMKISMLLSGILYSLRNNYMHGLAISSTKSSKSSIERYALYYYCFLSATTITNMLLIMDTDNSLLANERFSDLKKNVDKNLLDMDSLFGSRMD